MTDKIDIDKELKSVSDHIKIVCGKCNRYDPDATFSPLEYIIGELRRRLAESALREQSLMLQLGERDKRLAEANALCVKLAHQKGGQVDEMRSLKARLDEAEKWLDYKYDWRKPDFTSYDYENGDAKDTVDRIAKAFRVEAEN